jgi:hypothetical protein
MEPGPRPEIGREAEMGCGSLRKSSESYGDLRKTERRPVLTDRFTETLFICYQQPDTESY